MEHIKAFFKKYFTSIDRDRIMREVVASVCSEVVKVKISPDSLRIVRGAIDISRFPAHYKHQLFIEKQRILDMLKNIPETQSLTDLR